MSTVDEMEETGARELFARAPVEERSGFRADLRSRLLAEVGPSAALRRTAPWWALRVPRPLLAGLASFALLFGLTGSAAAGSLPGEPLFEVKRAVEELALALAFDDETRVERLAAQASARVAELERAREGAGRSAAALEAARALERLTGAQRSSDPGTSASDTAESARDSAESVLRGLEQRLPAEAADGIRRAIEAGRPAQRGPADRDSSPSEPPRSSPPGRASSPPGRGDPQRPTPSVPVSTEAPRDRRGNAPAVPPGRSSTGSDPAIPTVPPADR